MVKSSIVIRMFDRDYQIHRIAQFCISDDTGPDPWRRPCAGRESDNETREMSYAEPQ